MEVTGETMGENDAGRGDGGGEPPWSRRVRTEGLDVLVPDRFERWDTHTREGYLIQRTVFAAEGRVVRFAHDCFERAREAGGRSDPWDLAVASLGAAMSISAGRADGLVGIAVEMVERLPRTAVLLWGGWIGLEAVRAIVEHTRMVSDEAIAALDAELAESLGPTRRRHHAPKIGPLRRMLGRMILRRDPVGAEARARRARTDTDVRMDPIGDDRAAISATVTAEVGVEIMERIEQMARRAADGDTRTLPQRRAAGLLALCRGWDRLPVEDGSYPGDPDAQGSSRKVVLYAFEPVVAGAPVELCGYGPVTRATADRLEADARRRVESVGALADRESPGALRHAPSEALRRFCQGRDGTCVFPGCSIEAERCDLDHTIPFDHDHPDRGGRTTSDDLADLCRRHHRLKTAGIWAYYKDRDGTFVWIHGPRHPAPDAGTSIRVEPTGPLASLAAPVDPTASPRQRSAAEMGRTGDTAAPGPSRPTRRERRSAERDRLRARVERNCERRRARPTEDSVGDPPPF